MLLPASFTPLWTRPGGASSGGYWFVLQSGRLLVDIRSPERPKVPRLAPGETPPVAFQAARCVGMLDEAPCWATRTEDVETPVGFAFEPLRRLFDRLPDELVAIAGRAAQVTEFDRTHRYCGVCATPTEITDEARARVCPSCGEISYPRLSPAIMALVTRDSPAGRQILLARGTRSRTPVYSALAGFVEPSESLEECVRREVREEVGLHVGRLRYYGSGSWPFPHSLMIGFLADYLDGEISCQPGEIGDAQWFSPERLPQLPHRLSLSRRLIEQAIAEAKLSLIHI